MTDMPRKTLLLTGAFSKLGRATAHVLAARGWNLILHGFSTSDEVAGDLCAELGNEGSGDLLFVRADFSEPRQIGKLFEVATQRFARIDALVNNAGVLHRRLLLDTTPQDLQSVLAINATAPLLCMQQAVAAGATRIVNIIDAGHDGAWRNHAAYLASKAALASLTRVAARELAPDVQINGVAPGFVSQPEGQEVAHPNLIKRIPMKRRGTPEEIADVVCYLLSSPRYLTGQIIAVDGALTAR